MLAKNMPALNDDQTYQLWAIDAGTPISLGLLGPHPTAAAFTIGSALPSALAVSVEPAGGAVSPTTPIARGALGAV
jgi:anti-sigma-K factor RskA